MLLDLGGWNAFNYILGNCWKIEKCGIHKLLLSLLLHIVDFIFLTQKGSKLQDLVRIMMNKKFGYIIELMFSLWVGKFAFNSTLFLENYIKAYNFFMTRGLGILDILSLYSLLLNEEWGCTHCHLCQWSLRMWWLEFKLSVHEYINHFKDVYIVMSFS